MATNIYEQIAKNLEAYPKVPAVMPPCADVLLSLVGLNGKTHADIVDFFEHYFRFERHMVFPSETDFAAPDTQLHNDLATCLGVRTTGAAPKRAYPPEHCFPHVCVTLAGDRHGGKRLDRLFVADLLWLFFMERMGTFQILGAILDDIATGGAYPISSHTLPSFVAELMIRQTQTGSSSYQRGRVAAYQRGLGWVTPRGREMKVGSTINTAFNQLFHKVVVGMLGFYRDRRLANAINATTSGTASVATRTELVETIRLLKNSFDAFDYGRVYQDTLVGIVWVVAAIALLFELKDDLGIPKAYDEPYEFIPAAYDMLVAKQPITPSEINRYSTHVACANHGRMLLLAIQGLLEINDANVKLWLEDGTTESIVESYRTGYRNLTGIDLGIVMAGSINVDQQA